MKDKYKVVIAFDEPEFGPQQTAPIDDANALPTFIFNISINLERFWFWFHDDHLDISRFLLGTKRHNLGQSFLHASLQSTMFSRRSKLFP